MTDCAGSRAARGMGFSHAAAACALVALCAAPGYGDALFSAKTPAVPSPGAFALSIAASVAPLLAIAGAAVLSQSGPRAVLAEWFPRGAVAGPLRKAALWLAAAVPLVALVTVAFRAAAECFAGRPLPVQTPAHLIADPGTPAWLAVSLAACALAEAPVLEEIVFRGVIWRGFRSSGSPAFAAFMSSFAFAAAHRNFAAMPGLFVFGLVQARLCGASGSLWPCVAFHCFFNAVSLLPMFLTRFASA